MSDPATSSTQKAIAALWQRNLPQVLERLQILDRAVAAAASQELTSHLCKEAANVAHKFAGSLGMFGFHEGTRLARELEEELENPEPQYEQLKNLVARLRESLSAGEQPI